MRAPMITVRALGNLPEIVFRESGERGLHAVTEQAGLPLQLFESGQRDLYIPQAALLRFLAAGSRQLGLARLGLAAAPHMTVGDYGLWGAYVLAAPTLDEALKRSREALYLHSSDDLYWHTPCEEGLRVGYKFALYGARDCENVSYVGAAVILSLIRFYAGAAWRPRLLALDVDDKRAGDLIEETFGAPVELKAPSVSFVVPWHLLPLPRPGGPAARTLTLADVVRSRRGKVPDSLPQIVAELVRLQSLNGPPSLEEAAASLSLGPRTLQRQLKLYGVNFRLLSNAVVVERAKEMLRERSITITRIAAELGYSSSAHFARAFGKETGCTPNAFRKSLPVAGNVDASRPYRAVQRQ